MLQVRIEYDRAKAISEIKSVADSYGLFDINNSVTMQCDSIAKEEAYRIYNEIIRYTPVRTGKLKAGWMIQKINNGYLIYNTVNYAETVNNRTNFVRKAMT